MVKSKLFNTKTKISIWLLGFLLLNVYYKRFIQHTSGPDFGQPNELYNIIPSGTVVITIDIIMYITGFIAFVWLIGILIVGFFGLFKNDKIKERK